MYSHIPPLEATQLLAAPCQTYSGNTNIYFRRRYYKRYELGKVSVMNCEHSKLASYITSRMIMEVSSLDLSHLCIVLPR